MERTQEEKIAERKAELAAEKKAKGSKTKPTVVK